VSATYNNQIEIVLFTNNKRKSDKAPHETGTVTFPDGTKYDVAVWNRVSKAGNPFKSGTLKLPDPKYASNSNSGGNFGGGNAGGVDIDF
jgi:uncharacterized protein (DUF736 family)